jgi:hypothetical protein
MKKIDVNEVLTLKARLREINELELDEVILIKNGVEIPVSQEAKDMWKFSGILLTDYILMMNDNNQVEIIVKNFPKKM